MNAQKIAEEMIALAHQRRQDIGVNDLLQAHGSRRSFRFRPSPSVIPMRDGSLAVWLDPNGENAHENLSDHDAATILAAALQTMQVIGLPPAKPHLFAEELAQLGFD